MADFLSALLTVLIGAVAMAFVLTIALLIGYAGGSLFDHILGTTITPITTVYGLITGISVFNGVRKPNWHTYSLLRGLVTTFVAAPLVAMLGSALALWLFPGTVQSFLQMVNFGGSLYALAFWGSLIMGMIKTAIDTITLLVHGLSAD